MVLQREQKTVNNLIMETSLLLCKGGLTYTKKLKVEGLIGITVDETDFLVHLNETYEKSSPTVDSTRVDKFSKPASRDKKQIREREKHPKGHLKEEVVDLTENTIEPLTAEQKEIRSTEKLKVQRMITDNIELLCRNSLTYKNKVTIAAVVGVTVDTDVFLVHVSQDLKKVQDIECEIIDADSSDQPPQSKGTCKGSEQKKSQESREPCKGSEQKKNQEKRRNRHKDEKFIDLTETSEEPERHTRKTESSFFMPQPLQTSVFTPQPRRAVSSSFTTRPHESLSSSFTPQHRSRVPSSFTRHGNQTSHGKGPYMRDVRRPQRKRRVVQNISDSDDSPPSSPNRRPTTRLQTNSLPKAASAPKTITPSRARVPSPRPLNEHVRTSSSMISSDTYQENEGLSRTPSDNGAHSRTPSDTYQSGVHSRTPSDTHQNGAPSRTPSDNGAHSRTPSDTYQSGAHSRTPSDTHQNGSPSRTPSDTYQSGTPSRTPDTYQQNGARSRTPPMSRDQQDVGDDRFRPYHLPQTPNRSHLQLQPTEAETDIPTARRALNSALLIMNQRGRDPRQQRDDTGAESQPSGSQTTENLTYSTVELETNSPGHTFSDEVAVQSARNGSVDRTPFVNESEMCIGSISSLDTSYRTTGNLGEEMELSTVTIINRAEDEVNVIDMEADGSTHLGEESNVLQSSVLGNNEQYQQRKSDTQTGVVEPTNSCHVISATENGNNNAADGSTNDILRVSNVEGNSSRFDKLSNLDVPETFRSMDVPMESNEALDTDVTDIKCRAFSPSTVEGNRSFDYSYNDSGNTAASADSVSSGRLLQEDMKPCNFSMAFLLENLVVHPVLQKQEVTVTSFRFTWRDSQEWQDIVNLRSNLDDVASRELTLSFFISTIVGDDTPATSFPSVGYWVVTRHPDFNKNQLVKNMKAASKGAEVSMLLKSDGGHMDEVGALVTMLKDYSNVKVQRHIAISAHKAGIQQDHPTMRVILRETFFQHMLKNAMKKLQKVPLSGSLEQVM